MTRTLFCCLIRLHPYSFRARFQEEMLDVFDEAESEWGAHSLVGDAVASLFRLWLTHPFLWRWVLASIGGFLFLAIAFGSFLPWDRPVCP